MTNQAPGAAAARWPSLALDGALGCRPSQIQTAQTDIGKHVVVERLEQAAVPPLLQGQAGTRYQVETEADPLAGRLGRYSMHGENLHVVRFARLWLIPPDSLLAGT